MDQATIKRLVEEVVRELAAQPAAAPSSAAAQPVGGGVTTMTPTTAGHLTLTETGDAARGTDPKEVVIALSPAFSSSIHETIIGIPHATVLKEICAGIEEEGLAYRFATVGFIFWTFTLIAGAIWAGRAWGRFWGWDVKEVWTFIIWVLYAGYLHATATRGWSGTRAAWLCIVGFAAVLFNFGVVNVFFTGLHSYSGL